MKWTQITFSIYTSPDILTLSLIILNNLFRKHFSEICISFSLNRWVIKTTALTNQSAAVWRHSDSSNSPQDWRYFPMEILSLRAKNGNSQNKPRENSNIWENQFEKWAPWHQPKKCLVFPKYWKKFAMGKLREL